MGLETYLLSTVYRLAYVTFDMITSQETINTATQLDNSKEGNEVETGMRLRCEEKKNRLSPGGFSQHP
jgi:hypothetical protein